jgi:hypothetical protein
MCVCVCVFSLDMLLHANLIQSLLDRLLQAEIFRI